MLHLQTSLLRGVGLLELVAEPLEMSRIPAVFFDRDGVVNVSPGEGYVTRWEDFHLTEGVSDALALCRARGYRCVLVTSQRCVGKGLISEDALEELHHRMQEALRGDHPSKPDFDAVYAFTGLPGSETWEKPNPGMILQARRDGFLDLERSWLIGDHDRDIRMARHAGIRSTIRVRTHHTIGVPAEFTVESPGDLVALLDRVLPSVGLAPEEGGT